MTLNEKRLAIALLKEKLENISGKKVIFDENLEKKNIKTISLSLDDVGLRMFQRTPTFSNLLPRNQLLSLKAGKNILNVNHYISNKLQNLTQTLAPHVRYSENLNEAFVDKDGNYMPDELDSNISGETAEMNALEARIERIGKHLHIEPIILKDYLNNVLDDDIEFYAGMSDSELSGDIKLYQDHYNGNNIEDWEKGENKSEYFNPNEDDEEDEDNNWWDKN
jgi:hypothetical protein